MTAFFKRNEKTTIAELEEYYKNQPKKRTGMAWFMALLSIVITLLVIVGLFLAGRWVFRAISGDDNDQNTITSLEGEEIQLPSFDSNVLGGDRGLRFEDSNSNDQRDVVVEDTPGSISAGEVSDQAASTETPNADRIANNNQTNEAQNSAIPDTGAGEMIVFVLIISGVAGYFISRRYFVKQN
jgi:uncharacterized protein YneF (UPF0154 family)